VWVMLKSRAPLFIGIAIVAILAGALSAQFMRSPSQPVVTLSSGTLLPGGRDLPDFQLVDSSNTPYTRSQLAGHWSVLFFGFTNCPDICPTTLSLLAQVEKTLQNLPTTQRPQMVFVSVDPKRDTPAQVASYIKFFSPDFVGLTGELTQVEQFTRAMGVPVQIHDSGNGAYTVDHAATMFLLDPQARLTAVFSPPHQVNTLTSDLRTVITTLSQ
jgi:protein SCO1/2